MYFVHIPKTAGTSFRWMLEAQYPAARCCQVYPALPGLVFHVPGAYPPIDAETADRIDCFSSHAPLGTFPALEQRLAAITLLREPVSRELSLYAYSLQSRGGRRRQELEGLTLPQYVDLMHERHQDNMQVRMLSGIGFAGGVDDAALSAARGHLRERITAFGLTERFTDSMIVFGRLFGWRSMRLFTRNVTPRAARSLSETLRRRLADMNRYDTLLYEDARALFDERLRRHPITEAERRGAREAAGLERVIVYQQRLMRRLLRVRLPRSS